MGRKKGKMSSSPFNSGEYPKKWMSTEILRNLHDYQIEGRKTSFHEQSYRNHQKLRQQQQQKIHRPMLSFPHLNYLISERLQSDARNYQPSTHHPIFSATMMDKNTQHRQQLLYQQKVHHLAQDYFQHQLLPEPSPTNPLTLQVLTIQSIAKNLSLYEEEDFLILLHHLTGENLCLLNYYCTYFNHHNNNEESVSKILSFARFPLQSLYFPSSCSDKMIGEYLHFLTDNSFQIKEDIEENWEDIDIHFLNSFMDRTRFIHSICFFQSQLTLSRLHEIMNNLPFLQSLSFVNTSFLLPEIQSFDDYYQSQQQKRSPQFNNNDKDGLLAEQLFQLIASSCRGRELQIELIYCSWINWQCLDDFLRLHVLPDGVLAHSITLTIFHCIDPLEGSSHQDREDQRRRWQALMDQYNTSTAIKLNVTLYD